MPRPFGGLSVLVLVAACGTVPAQDRPRVRGAYGSPEGLWQTGGTLRESGIDALFIHHGGSDEEYERALREGVRVYAEFGVFRDHDRAKAEPEDLWPVGSDGEGVAPTERFLGLCPTNERYNEEKLWELADLVRRRPGLSGVWLDYLHFHCDFELPDPPLMQTCFNDSCLERFARDTGMRIPDGTRAEKARWILNSRSKEWADWKCSVIADFARRAREVLERERPGLLLGVYSAPWTDGDYDGGARNFLGQDIDRLSPWIDVWSPIVYHGNCERSPAWSEAYTRWLVARVGARDAVWPIVQGGGEPKIRTPVTAEGFEEALRGAFRGGATGVMFYHLGAVAADPAKRETLRRVYAPEPLE
jgi:hypothetical protein